MAGELKLNEVATPTTPASGKDGIFVSNDTPARMKRVDSAGTVWPIAEHFFISTTADYTLTAGSSAQKCFNGSTNGAVTVPASMSYYFEWVVALTNAGTTSHTWGLLFGGTATLTSGNGVGTGETATSNALTAVSTIYSTTLGTVLVLTAASTSATENAIMTYRGVIRINAGGTLIPQIKASADPVGASKVLANSHFRMTPIGSDTAASLGPWS